MSLSGEILCGLGLYSVEFRISKKVMPLKLAGLESLDAKRKFSFDGRVEIQVSLAL